MYVCIYVFYSRPPQAFQIQEQRGKGVTPSAEGLGGVPAASEGFRTFDMGLELFAHAREVKGGMGGRAA